MVEGRCCTSTALPAVAAASVVAAVATASASAVRVTASTRWELVGAGVAGTVVDACVRGRASALTGVAGAVALVARRSVGELGQQVRRVQPRLVAHLAARHAVQFVQQALHGRSGVGFEGEQDVDGGQLGFRRRPPCLVPPARVQDLGAHQFGVVDQRCA